MTGLARDLRYAMRVLWRSPGFTITAVLVLALAMGANTAIFSVIEAVLLRPLPYPDSERLCVLWKSIPARAIEWDWTSYPAIRDWREQNHTFSDLAVVLRPEASLFTLASDAAPEKIQGARVSGNFFEVLGVAPQLGRTFSRAETERGENVVVLSDGFWRRRFAASPNILGRSISLDQRSATIIGVMPPAFQFPDQRAQMWMLVTSDPRWSAFERVRVADAFCALGRLRPGVHVEQAQAEMAAISARLARAYAATDANLGVRVVPLARQIAGARVRRALWILGAAVFCVLLMACSNIAGLLVARGVARGRELAVRAALGAGRARLLWQLAAENLVLSVAGGIAGLLCARWTLDALLAFVPADLPRAGDVGINPIVLAFSFGLCLVTGMAFGLWPALQITKTDPSASLTGGGRASSGPGVQRTRGVLVALQFACAIMLLTGAGLLVRSFLLLNATRPGFETSHLLTMTLDVPAGRHDILDQAARRISALPGVLGAAAGEAVLGSFRDHVPNQRILVEGRPETPDIERHGRNVVSDSYFQVVGIPLLRGRLFAAEDDLNRPRAAVINQTMARRFWPAENPIGKRFRQVLPGLDSPWLTVVGVVGDVLYNRDGAVVPLFYLSTRQWPGLVQASLVVRTAADPAGLAPAIRQVVRSVDHSIPSFEIATAEQRLQELDRPRRFETMLITLFAVVALLLSAIGLYGLTSYAVAQRTREIGIRLALGATGGAIVRLVLRQGFAWVLGGAVAGAAGAFAFGRALSASLVGITPADPVTLGAVIVVLAAVAATACSLPTRRAARIDPSLALRH